MISLPLSFEERMKIQLKDEAGAFFSALRTESPVSVRLNPGKPVSPGFDFVRPENQLPWCKNAYHLNKRPIFTLDPCFHGGAYYVQEASSMFLSHILQQIMPDTPIRALDLCAAPGGKSTLIASALPAGSLLVSNEVIRSRASILKENIIKWGQDNVVVTGNDPADFSNLTSCFDLVLVDAPCSGEGMFRKDSRAIEEWSESNLQLCSERQKRILSDIWDSLKPGGFLIYSTCTYNRGENEDILDWLIKNHQASTINIEHSFGDIIPTSGQTYGYHFYPHKVKGEGFFIGVVQKTDGKECHKRKEKKDKTKPITLTPEISRLISQAESFRVYQTDTAIGVIPQAHADFITSIESQLRILYKGCEIAEPNNRKTKWLHPFALYQGLKRDNCIIYNVPLLTALTYLKKEEIPVMAKAGEWVLITHKNISLGWGKSLGNRLNNYYPKEWRIRMNTADAGLSEPEKDNL